MRRTPNMGTWARGASVSMLTATWQFLPCGPLLLSALLSRLITPSMSGATALHPTYRLFNPSSEQNKGHALLYHGKEFLSLFCVVELHVGSSKSHFLNHFEVDPSYILVDSASTSNFGASFGKFGADGMLHCNQPPPIQTAYLDSSNEILYQMYCRAGQKPEIGIVHIDRLNCQGGSKPPTALCATVLSSTRRKRKIISITNS
jgi:hypothetical protein